MALERLGWIADGFRLNDYGSPGYDESNKLLDSSDGVAFVACLPGSAVHTRVYAILIEDGRFPDAAHVRWQFTNVATDPVHPRVVDHSPKAWFNLDVHPTQAYEVEAQIRTSTGSVLKTLRQYGPKAWPERKIDGILNGLGDHHASGTNPWALSFVYHNLRPSIDAVTRGIHPGVVRDLLVALLLAEIGDVEPLLFPKRIKDDFEAEKFRHTFGLFPLHLVAAAMLVGPGGLTGSPYLTLQWTNPAGLAKHRAEIPDNLTGKLRNLCRFPSTNMRLAARLIAKVLENNFPDLSYDKLQDKALLRSVCSRIMMYQFACDDERAHTRRIDAVVNSMAGPALQLLRVGLDEGRPVFVFLDGDKVLVRDSAGVSEDADKMLDLEHFGWRPAEALPSEKSRLDSAIDKLNPGEDNSFVLLDVGYWGHYDRERPQRNFGIIDGEHVFLCMLVPEGEYGSEPPGAGSTQDYKTDVLEKLAQALAEWNYSFKVQHHARARCSDPNRRFVVLPDLHLPTHWQLPPAKSSLPKKYVDHLKLRMVLRNAQSGTFFNSYNLKYIQQYIARLETTGQPNFNLSSVSLAYTEDTYTPAQFQAVKDSVDRELSMKNCWFYPLTGQAALEDPLEEYPSTTKVPDELECDPSPAIDLAALLVALRKVSGARLVHVGDLFEMWVDLEWLYLGYPRREDDTERIKDAGFGTRLFGIDATMFDGSNSFQYRLSGGWKTAEISIPWYTDDSAPLYVYHCWPIDELTVRYQTGRVTAGFQQLKQPAVDRAVRLMRERIKKIRDFSLPYPTTLKPGTAKLLGMLQSERVSDGGMCLQRAVEPFSSEKGEGDRYLWNRMIIQLMQSLNPIMIYGNHDGYRGDPTLNGPLDGIEKARPWYYERGIWFEHGHRWDPYNMDGVAMGAGVTSMVHYYFRPKVFWRDEFKSKWPFSFRQYWEDTIPGASRWHVILEKGTPNDWFQIDNDVGCRAFGKMDVCVLGHSHSPDLIRVFVQKVKKA
jgi:hypothetical protein